MRYIAIVNDSAEVVTMVNAVLTQGGRRVLKLIGPGEATIARVRDFKPDLIIVPMHRRNEALDRPIDDYRADVLGAELLEQLSAEPAFEGIPTILLGFATQEADMPADFKDRVRYTDFLPLPDALQELNPLVSGYIGPAEQGAPA